MAAIAYGKKDEFQPENESIAAYPERVELYFAANAIAENKQVPVFLSVIGAKTYTLLRNLLAPTKLSEAPLTEALTNHLEPKRVVIAERFHFYRPNQEARERVCG